MSGIYIHIPFCEQRCIYCDFFSSTKHAYIDRYIEALLCEAKLRPCNDEIHTTYMGGGTPSQLSVKQMDRLINGLKEIYDMTTITEFTVEVNPDDVTTEYIAHLKSLGVNRISMGVQSFIDDELTLINRRHDSKGAFEAVNSIQKAGIENISIDLIYGIPGQTNESWALSVDSAISLGVQHISAYNLSYETGTALWRMRENGCICEVSDAQCVEMYNMLTDKLKKAGFEHYEISNFGLPGYHSKHNSAYWDGTPYIGLGASAHSYDGDHRGYNPLSLEKYLESLESGILPIEIEESEWWEKYDETIMIALRTSKGVNLANIKNKFGDIAFNHLTKEAKKYLTSGELVLERDCYIIPEVYYMISDGIIRDLMWED